MWLLRGVCECVNNTALHLAPKVILNCALNVHKHIHCRQEIAFKLIEHNNPIVQWTFSALLIKTLEVGSVG